MSIDEFKTSDLPLASALVCSDFCVVRIEGTDSRRMIFIFRITKELTDTVDRFWNGETRVEPKRFSECQKALKARINSI